MRYLPFIVAIKMAKKRQNIDSRTTSRAYREFIEVAGDEGDERE